MKKFYSRFRVGLMTFTLGLAGFLVFTGSLKYSSEIPVDLPKVQSDSIIFVTPKKQICFYGGMGSHWTPSQKYTEEWKANCLKSNTLSK